MLIDAFTEDLFTQLDARAEALAPPCRLYLLIDGAFVPGLHRLLPAHEKALLFESLPGCSGEVKDASPFITPFKRSNKTLTKLMNRCNRWPMVSVIETDESFEQLATRLAAWCVVEVDGQRFNLRFPDTRRFPAIFRIFHDEQRAQFAGPARRWFYVSRGGRWNEIELAPSSAQIPIEEPVLGQHQFASLVDDSKADEVLVLLGDLGCDVYRCPSRSHALVSTAIQAAINRGLESDKLIRWCESFWKTDQRCDEHSATIAFDNWRLANEEKNDHICFGT